MTSAPAGDTDVLIVGAGPVGLMLACELRRRDISCRIIDKVSDFPQTSRAMGVQPRSMELFDSLGVADQVLARCAEVRGVLLMRGGRELVRMQPRAVQNARPSLRPDQPYHCVVIVNQAKVEGILRDKLAGLGGQVERQQELHSFEETTDGVVAEVADLASDTLERVGAKWLVGCDGARSTLRGLLHLPFQGTEYPEHLVLADVYLKGDLHQESVIAWLNDQGLLVGFPFREPGLWRLIATVTPDAQGNVPQASPDLFQHMLAVRGGDTRTQLVEAVWLSNFIVHHRMVPQYRKGRAFVAGDAAHIHSPAGGQGMNTGIQDAYNLGWKLALVVKGSAPEALLDTYEAERLPVARHVLEETDTNQKLGISRGPVAEFILNHMVAPLLNVPAVGERFLEKVLVKRGSQLDINYRSSCLAEQYDHLSAGPEAGDRAPDGQLLDRSGQATSLFAQFRTPDFRLLLFQGRTPAADVAELGEIGARVREASGGLVQPFLILDSHAAMSTATNDLILLRDLEQGTHNTYGASSACLYLVRPDGYVGFRSRLAGESKLMDYLGRNFLRQLAGSDR